MTETPLDLTITISNYNTRSLLRNCLESIYRYTHGISFEVICIDDNSSDGSPEMVAGKFPQVVLVRNKTNQLYAKNQNMGMRMARGRYVCLLDSDTVLRGNAFEALVRFMDEHPEAAACGPKLINLDGSVQHCIRRFPGAGVFVLQSLNWHKLFPGSRIMNRYYATDVDYGAAQPVESIGTSAYVIRRSTWEQAGMLDERFRLALVDLAYNYTLRQKGLQVYYTPCAGVVHLGSQSVNQDVIGSLRDQRRALTAFSDGYDYFGKGRFTKRLVRCAVWLRYALKVVEYTFSSDKRLIKGPGAPRKEVAAQATMMRKSE